MINVNEIVKDLDVPNGMTKRINCPVCKGYKTFSVDVILEQYAAGEGGHRVHLSVQDIRDAITDDVIDTCEIEFVLPDFVVPHGDREEVMDFCKLWKLNADELDLHYDVKEKRVVFLVKSNGTTVDAVGRSVTNRLPKWKRYGKNSLPYTYGCGKVAVVVEDCVSASVVGNDVYVGLAVLGTSLLDSHKRFLSRFSTAIIALDPDALPKTLSFAKELRGYVKDIKILRLTDDLKYRKPIDMDNLMNLTQKETQKWN